MKKTVDEALAGRIIKTDEIRDLFAVPLFSEESFYIQWAGRKLSEECSGGLAEIHGQVGVNSGPCACNCAFCSFAKSNRIFTGQYTEPMEKIIGQCLALQNQGANAIYLMATAAFSFTDYLEIAMIVKMRLNCELPLIANVGDLNYQMALALKEAGFDGIYHAVRMGEGQVTRIDPQKRLASFAAARNAGLILGTCVEPIGPEHTLDELVEKTLIAREAQPAFSGAMRRVNIPGGELSVNGMTGEARMAHILAVVRLAMGHDIPGNCTHEPNVLGCCSGANLLWAEAGSNPRDIVLETEASRGLDMQECRNVLAEAEWQVLEGPSQFFTR
ncbi:MAG: radical SAM protein [Deltaproteobacteria bacterium]